MPKARHDIVYQPAQPAVLQWWIVSHRHGPYGIDSNERPEVHQFVEHMFRQMAHRRIEATDFSTFLAWFVGAFVSKLLPGAWGGAVPPITLAGRHVRIDDYIEMNPWGPLKECGSFFDLGCELPPITTVESATRFPKAKLLVADPSFGRYLVREENND